MLRWQIQMVDQLGYAGIDIDQSLREFLGMTGDVAYALYTVEFSDVFNQQRKVGNLAISHHTAISINVLSKQRDFAYTLIG